MFPQASCLNPTHERSRREPQVIGKVVVFGTLGKRKTVIFI